MSEAISTAQSLPPSAPERLAQPSSLYRGNVWKLAMAGARTMPRPLAQAIAKATSQLYRLATPRWNVVYENLLPAFDNNEDAARQATTRLFSRFATKMVDLLRFEAGAEAKFSELTGWEILENAHRRGAGTLLVTPHLGNWEIGSPLVMKKGIKFFAVTQAEPGSNFTEIRRAARLRWGIETIVVGQDAFSFVEIIRRLQEGAAVALLIDRPAPQSATTTQLFGRRFHASLAPAELARASGCAVIGGIIVEENGGYASRFLPEFQYDRRELGSREARAKFTQEIVMAFEPSIRRYADQWYHFVPIWPTK